ncbi:MAG: hypothetical protein H6686_11490 [Fibrobacteria bacterium]|nr:hypothetical protein [Fibrobacteria bacterium]
MADPGKGPTEHPWDLGPYDFQATFASNLVDAQGDVLTRFEWVSPKFPLKVTGASR